MITRQQECELHLAVDDYHFALDTRQHAGSAAEKLADAVQKILDRPWVSQAVLSAREQRET